MAGISFARNITGRKFSNTADDVDAGGVTCVADSPSNEQKFVVHFDGQNLDHATGRDAKNPRCLARIGRHHVGRQSQHAVSDREQRHRHGGK